METYDNTHPLIRAKPTGGEQNEQFRAATWFKVALSPSPGLFNNLKASRALSIIRRPQRHNEDPAESDPSPGRRGSDRRPVRHREGPEEDDCPTGEKQNPGAAQDEYVHLSLVY